MKFTIPGELPSMNEIVKASKAHHMAYANMKKDYTALAQMSAGNLPEMKRVDVVVTWYCKNKRKDPDNVAAGSKFVLDGLVKAGKIPDDGWDEIRSLCHQFDIDKNNPRVEVAIYGG